jgi:hypothetical protein
MIGIVAIVAIAALGLAIPSLVFGIRSENHIDDTESLGRKVKDVNQQIEQLKAEIAQQNTAATAAASKGGSSGAAGAKVPPSELARQGVRGLIDAFRRSKASGQIHLPSAVQTKRALKSAGSSLLVSEDPEQSLSAEESQAAQFVSEYMQQRARALGLFTKKSRAAPLVDYDHDYDGDGIPDFSVVHMDDTMVVPPLPPQPLSLTNGMRLDFSVINGPSSYIVERLADGPLASVAGHTALPLGDDDNNHVFLAHSFSFNGSMWSDLYVNSDGSVSFGSAASSSANRDIARVFSSPPMITPILADLDNTCSAPGAGIFFFSDASQSVFTWLNVPHYERGDEENFVNCNIATGNDFTFQLILNSNGNFEFRYGHLDAEYINNPDVTNTAAVTAVTRGPGEYSPVTYIDFGAVTTPVAFEIGTIGAQWSDTGSQWPSIILDLAVRRFYESHPDHYDQVMTMSAGFGVGGNVLTDGSTANFNRRVFQRTLGIGERQGYHSSSSAFPVNPELESVIYVRHVERLVRLDEKSLIDPTIKPITNLVWRTNTKKGFSIDYLYGSVDGINFTGFPWEINFTAVSPISSPAEPFFIDLTAKGANSGYTHETIANLGGVRSSGGPSTITQFHVAAHELFHRWNTFIGLRHPDSSQWGDHFFDLLSRGRTGVGGAHPGTMTDVRVSSSPWGDTDAKFLPKRPRGDPMCYSAGHITQLIPKPGDPSKFIDSLDPSAVYPDTPSFDMAVADELCRAQGLDLFVTTPQATKGGFSVRSLAFSGIVPINDTAILNNENFYVDSPRSPFGALGFDFDLREVSGLSELALQNLLFCGKRRVYKVADTTNIADVRLSASAQAFLGPMEGPSSSQTTLGQLYYGPRAPLIGDEGDVVDLAVKAQYPDLYDQLNLDACPIVSSSNCNAGAFGRYGATCVDVKSVAPVILAKPGYTPTKSELDAFGRLINVLRRDLAKYMISGYGARGQEGDQCYIPKFSFGIPQILH